MCRRDQCVTLCFDFAKEYFFSALEGEERLIRELHGDLSADSSDTRGMGVI